MPVSVMLFGVRRMLLGQERCNNRLESLHYGHKIARGIDMLRGQSMAAVYDDATSDILLPIRMLFLT